MPYIQRNESGAIVAVSIEQAGPITEWIEADAPELRDYLNQLAGENLHAANALEESDHALVRVVDDLVNMLVEKNLMRFTDLPEAAQKKLLARRSMRQSLTALKLLADEEHTLL